MQTIQLKVLEVLGAKSNGTKTPGKTFLKVLVHTEPQKVLFSEITDKPVSFATGNSTKFNHMESSQDYLSTVGTLSSI